MRGWSRQEHQTPIMTAEITAVTFPPWNVPLSIVKNELRRAGRDPATSPRA